MDKKELYQYVGSMQQMAYIRKVTCEEGRSTGLRMFDVKNECLQYQVMCDKCLDVAGLTYKGINMNFLSKPGLQGRNHYDTFREEPLMLLYHINLGYPFLTPATKLYIPTKKVAPRDEASAGHEADYDHMDRPKKNEPEYVFIHDIKKTKDKRTWVFAVNPDLKLGLKIEYSTKNFPYFMEWKSTAAGDYVIGLEPSNSSVYGRGLHEKNGDLHMLKPFEKERNELIFTVLDGEEEIRAELEKFNRINCEAVIRL